MCFLRKPLDPAYALSTLPNVISDTETQGAREGSVRQVKAPVSAFRQARESLNFQFSVQFVVCVRLSGCAHWNGEGSEPEQMRVSLEEQLGLCALKQAICRPENSPNRAGARWEAV